MSLLPEFAGWAAAPLRTSLVQMTWPLVCSLGVKHFPNFGREAGAKGTLCLAGTLPDGFCKCNQTYSPVCGADGQTYGNACIMGCENVPLASTGVCPPCNRVASGEHPLQQRWHLCWGCFMQTWNEHLCFRVGRSGRLLLHLA